MYKDKKKFGFVIFFLLILTLFPSLSAKEKDTALNFFLNMTTGTFEAFAFGGGVDINFYKFFSIRPSIDLSTTGGRIIYVDSVFAATATKRIKPFFTVGYFDYYFKGSNRHDRDAIKSITFGVGINFYSKKEKWTSSLGVRFFREDETSYPLFYLNFVLFKLKL